MKELSPPPQNCRFRFAHTPSPPFLPEDFQLKRALGAGTFGTVYLAHYRVTQRWIALKVLAKRRLVEKNQVQHAMNEKKLMSACEHPFIAALLLHRKDTTYVYLGIELYNGGELFQAARDDGPWPDDVVSFYAAEILLALEYLHGVDILYRDLKTENVILDWKGHVRLTDFGFAKRISVRTYTVCGTLGEWPTKGRTRVSRVGCNGARPARGADSQKSWNISK